MILINRIILCVTISSLIFVACKQESQKEITWLLDTQQDFVKATAQIKNIKIEEGQLNSTTQESQFLSVVKRFDTKRKAKSLTIKQTPTWNHWQEIDKVTLPEMLDAPVFIPVKQNDYWLLARRYDTHPKRIKETRKTHTDDELGYHAWHSTDMKNWKHYGPVSGYRERWVTTAEYKNGKFYIYYDQPNDEDPHLIIDDDLTDGKMGKDMGLVFNDPSHGSDCGVIRDTDDSFHLIYENWDYNNAREHSWDAPVGGHAVSEDGIHDFKILDPAVDERTKSTGKFSTFTHPYKSDNPTTMTYEVHEPEQNAYGDWTAIKVGKQYYLFGDNDPVGEKIKVGCFTSDNLNKKFTFCGGFGMGHPDPTIGFAEGKFYLLQQKGDIDFVSSGPWIEGVSARVGADTDGDGTIDVWTKWEEIKETYHENRNFLRVVDVQSATLSLNDLPEGYGFSFEYKTKSQKEQNATVSIEKVELKF